MGVERMKALLSGMPDLQQLAHRERTLFDVGARGYFENPTSDLLAFFLDSDAEHEFGNVVLSALLECLPDQQQPELEERYLIRSPAREWVTSQQQRIDLVLESERWVLAVEHKIYHDLSNDFAHYSEDLSLRLSGQDNRQVLCVVLSPEGLAPHPTGWLGIRYADFLARLRVAVRCLCEQHGESKWLLFLREFIIHLENLTVTDTLTDAQEQYVLENLGNIEALTQARNDALESLRYRLQEGINSRLGDLEIPITSSTKNWPVGPALHFVPLGWKGNSIVVVFLSKDHPKTVRVQPYIDKRNGDINALRKHGIDVNHFDNHSIGRDYYLLFHDFKEMHWEAIEKAAADYLRAIISMESEWQKEAT
ncbi:PD-(D/E)XK nuclease family protein [Vreelandella jeotgali]|uniref:PD-(D/E)XK nuclease family protein n=1 Tax=Vreelandella jeotgali TaxID=553386 RepID=UPI000348C89D|nr:PD-(D/E)XK nuclease family protein [Halomonas jeotgali]